MLGRDHGPVCEAARSGLECHSDGRLPVRHAHESCRNARSRAWAQAAEGSL